MKTFEKQTAIDFANLLECIDRVYGELLEYKSLKIANKSLTGSQSGEYGFYIKAKDSTVINELFVGLWLGYWADTGFPMIITIDTKEMDSEKLNREMRRIQSQHPKYFEKFHIYNDWPVLTLTDYIVYNEEYHPELVKIIYAFCKFLGL